MASVLNKAAVWRFLLAYAKEIGRDDVIAAVAPEVYAELERIVRRHGVGLIESHPSAFKTLRAPGF